MVTWTAKGPKASCSLWHLISLRCATAHVLGCPPLIHTASTRDAAGFRQSVMMLVIVRLWTAPETLVEGALMRTIVWSSCKVRALRHVSPLCWAYSAGVRTSAWLGFFLGRTTV